MSVLEIFDDSPGDISRVSSRYLVSVLEIFGECPSDIFFVCPGGI